MPRSTSRRPTSKSAPKQRADQLAVQQGLAATRNKAQALILAGQIVDRDGRRIDKPGQQLAADTALSLKGEACPFVSRGGLKLDAALRACNVDVRDLVCLDIGASTGGFTDCLLQRGARRVYAVDVGYGQLEWSLRGDARVVVIERENIRHLDAARVPEPCGIVVIDVSFISLKLVLPAARRFAAPGARLVALIKPQFEVGKGQVGKGGVVRDEAARVTARDGIVTAALAEGCVDVQTLDSPIAGAKGNREYLLVARWP